MYCSDCHGSAVTTAANNVIPETGNAWGPHGSGNPFILKGVWGGGMNTGTANLLCLKCHNPTSSSGFSGGGRGNLHQYHIDKIGKINCTWCHVAVPHGWKNRSLLVNLNDVGEEAGFAAGTSREVAISGNSTYYTKPPYYLNARLKVYSFGTSGSWSDTNCGSRQKTGSNIITSNGANIGGSASTADAGTGAGTSNYTSPATGKDWMRGICSSPSN
jgi:hypothetical protein